jgi:hypothetical protein
MAFFSAAGNCVISRALFNGGMPMEQDGGGGNDSDDSDDEGRAGKAVVKRKASVAAWDPRTDVRCVGNPAGEGKKSKKKNKAKGGPGGGVLAA